MLHTDKSEAFFRYCPCKQVTSGASPNVSLLITTLISPGILMVQW